MLAFKELKTKGMELKPTIWIGKAGLTDSVVKEVRLMLQKKKLIKVKFLKSILQEKDKKELAKELAEKTDSELIHQVGFIAVLRKNGIPKHKAN